MTCTFFGHKDTDLRKITNPLKEVLVDLIENKGVKNFYVGNQGHFDYGVFLALKELKEIYPHINHSIALAYVPKEKSEYDTLDYSICFVPDGVEKSPLKFAIDRRNRWMIKNSNYVVTCVRSIIGGAAKYKELAEKKGKTVINIAERPL